MNVKGKLQTPPSFSQFVLFGLEKEKCCHLVVEPLPPHRQARYTLFKRRVKAVGGLALQHCQKNFFLPLKKREVRALSGCRLEDGRENRHCRHTTARLFLPSVDVRPRQSQRKARPVKVSVRDWVTRIRKESCQLQHTQTTRHTHTTKKKRG